MCPIFLEFLLFSKRSWKCDFVFIGFFLPLLLVYHEWVIFLPALDHPVEYRFVWERLPKRTLEFWDINIFKALQAFNFHVKLFLPRTSFIHLARKLDVSHLQHCLVIILNFSDSVVVSISNLLVILISCRNRVLDVPIKRFDFFLHRRFDFTA